MVDQIFIGQGVGFLGNGATENLMPYALGYGHIIVLGFPFFIIGTVINFKNIKLRSNFSF